MEQLDQINLKKSDPSNMLSHIENFCNLLSRAYEEAQTITIPSYYLKSKKIVLLGMGGSGIANEMVKSLANKSLKLPIYIIHDYKLPLNTDEDTLVIASSYSGNTEEVLTGFIEAYEKKAKLIAITMGGKLEVLAKKYKAPCFTFSYKSQPRAAMPYNFAFLLSVFVKLGFYNLPYQDFKSTMEMLNQFSDQFKASSPATRNQAKQLASKLIDRVPVIYASDYLDSAARRMKTQINENSKNFAFTEDLPELNHNSSLGLTKPKSSIYVLMLKSNYDLERNQKRFDVTLELNLKNKISSEILTFKSFTHFEEVLKFIILGDFISFYLAVLNQVDPEDTGNIEWLKKHLG